MKTIKGKTLKLIDCVIDTGDGHDNDVVSTLAYVPNELNLQETIEKIENGFEGTDLEDNWSTDDVNEKLIEFGVEFVEVEKDEVVY